MAAGQLQRGNVDQAAATGSDVVAIAWALSSGHVDCEIRQLMQAVRRTGSTSPSCMGFLARAQEYLAARATG